MKPLALIKTPSFIDAQTKLYKEEYYLQRLPQEKLRAERSKNPLSLLIIDMPPHLKPGNGKDHPNSKLLFQLIQVLHAVTRETDIKAWYQKDKIAILLPDTPRIGALKLADKVSQEAKKIMNGHLHKETDLSLFVYTYGENEFPSSSAPPQSSGVTGTVPPNTTMDFQKTQWNPIAEGNIAVIPDSHFFDMLNESVHSTVAPLEKAVKRGIDIIGSCIGIILTAPLMAIISVIIKLYSPGPIFFKQERVGFRGKRFTFFKFRSMECNTDDALHREHVMKLLDENNANDGSWAKLDNDCRITPFGKFLRKTSLDELPQFFNVLKGEMSLVGPRPPIPYEVNNYQLWHLKRIREVKPGISGLWQVEGRSCTTFNDMVRLDVKYVNNWSLWLDIKIILKTFLVILSTRGAK